MSTTATLPRPSRAARTRRAWRILTLIELKLLIRTPAALFWGIGFPVIGLIVLGAIPAPASRSSRWAASACWRPTSPSSSPS